MTMIVCRRQNWWRSLNSFATTGELAGFARRVTLLAVGMAWAAGCTTEEASTTPVETAVAAVTSVPAKPATRDAFVAFESGQTRPLALSADGRFLYAANTPDNRVEIFRVSGRRLQLQASVPVGLEPVALAERRSGELWVVNHLSDSVSIVDVVRPEEAHVVRTLLVGDEPRDIVFAGPHRARAFVTTAHRGQNTGRDPQLTTPGVGRADVWVFDADHLGASLAGAPLTVITLFADTPRALAVSADGRTVYAAAFQSGNQTTSLHERIVTPDGGLPPPGTNAQGVPRPPTALIVKYRTDPADGQLHWLDNIGRRWDEHVKLSLPDKDVFAIDAAANPPAPKPAGAFAGVGTVLFNMAVNPISGKVYVANTDARNDVRFEGHNAFGPTQGAPAGSVRGHIAENRITVIDPAAGVVTPRHLNKHIDYSKDGTPDEAAKSLAFPTDMVVTPDGRTLYVAALGSSKVGVLSTHELETDTFVPSEANQIPVTGGGPTGLALDARGGLLYVLTRFDNAISVVDVRGRHEIAHLPMFNPEPASVVKGRPFLYDATLTSSHGDSACASCHIFGDFDSLAWDLGDPDDIATPIPGPFVFDLSLVSAIIGTAPFYNHSLKGPMTTQSLRGMANHGPMHWRGDRTGGTDASRLVVLPSAQPDTGSFDEQAAFKKFNVAFGGLLGRSGPLSDEQMQAFTDFILQVTYPPNPNRNLDNSLTPDQQAGRDVFFAHTPDGTEIPSDTFHNCNGCHVLDPQGNAQFGVAKPGFFGSDGRYSFEQETQFAKVPHLRNLYQKVGMFGMDTTFDPTSAGFPFMFLPAPYNDDSFQGDQVRGFGFLHDGSTDTVFRFHSSTVFTQRDATSPFPNPGGFPVASATDDSATAQQKVLANIQLRRQVESFMMAFDSNEAPIVGQQVTLAAWAGDDIQARIDLLEARAAAGECDLVVHGQAGGETVAFLYDPGARRFIPDRTRRRPVSDADLRALACDAELTFTAVPPGSGRRIGIDRDLDGVLDGDEQPGRLAQGD
jgi:DNA-binding beta-propeller fold protein YncE